MATKKKNKRMKKKQLDAYALETNLKDIAKKIADDPNDIELHNNMQHVKKTRNEVVGSNEGRHRQSMS